MTDERAAYVTLDGDLNYTRSKEVAVLLPDAGEVEHVVINCARAEFMDSFVMGMLVQLRRDFVAAGRDPQNLVIVLPASGTIRRAFEITGLTRIFSIAYAESEPRPNHETTPC
jgi:anti-anti-sigma factor